MARTPAWEPDYCEYFAARQRSFMRAGYAMLGSWPAAEDAVQTTFTALYARWPRITGDTPDAYARRVLVNVCIDISRRRNRELVTDRLPDREVEEQSSIDLMQALAQLSVRDRAVVALRYLEDLSVRDVALALDLPEGTVKSRSSRALTRLEHLLAHATEETSS